MRAVGTVERAKQSKARNKVMGRLIFNTRWPDALGQKPSNTGYAELMGIGRIAPMNGDAKLYALDRLPSVLKIAWLLV